jgi:dihydroflavonol-4-reductase
MLAMSRALVTGATGLVGHAIVSALLERGRQVRALVRTIDRGRQRLPTSCELTVGDVTDRASVERAVEGCNVVYHAAGLPEQWLRDARTFDRVNVGGTRNMIEASLLAKVERFVYTSTIDVFAAKSGTSFDESVIDPEPKGTAYERSKQAADREVAGALERGLPAVFLHPAAVYGPGPASSPGINDFIERLRDGRVPALLPGGLPVVFSRDVGAGHVLAGTKGAVGERFILSDRYISLADLARRVVDELGMVRLPLSIPLWAARITANVDEAVAKVTGRPPLVPKGQLYFLQWGARPRSDKARRELGLQFLPFEDGLTRTLDWLGRERR